MFLRRRNKITFPVKMSHCNEDWETVGVSTSSPAPRLFSIQSRKDDLTEYLWHPFIFTYHLLPHGPLHHPVLGHWPPSAAHSLVLGQTEALKNPQSHRRRVFFFNHLTKIIMGPKNPWKYFLFTFCLANREQWFFFFPNYFNLRLCKLVINFQVSGEATVGN